MSRLYTFGKKERLSQKKQIDRLFNEGRTFHLSPLKVIYLSGDDSSEYPVRILIAIPRRKFRNAVDRNRLRRLIRESYRLNKHLLLSFLEKAESKLDMGFIYTGNDKDIAYPPIEKSMIRCLQKLQRLIQDPPGC
jgi:ribonuclease P protein component